MATHLNKLRIGTRKSKLALIQAELVASMLEEQCIAGIGTELRAMSTSGDEAKDKKLADIGGKGLFVKELDDALLRKEIDIAVHSAKDVPSPLPLGLTLAAVLPREDARDVLVSHKASSIAELPHGATIGTSSPRRKAQLQALRPDFSIVDFRGNVPTRLRKLRDNAVDATILAMAGLKRLDMFDAEYMYPIPVSEMLPASGQGAICVTCREDDHQTQNILIHINDKHCHAAIDAERNMLETLEGSCYTPVAAHASINENILTLQATLFSCDGKESIHTTTESAIEEAIAIGKKAGELIIRQDSKGLRHG